MACSATSPTLISSLATAKSMASPISSSPKTLTLPSSSFFGLRKSLQSPIRSFSSFRGSHSRNSFVVKASSDLLLVGNKAPDFKAEAVFDQEFINTPKKMTASGENSADTKSALSRVAPVEAILFDIDGTLCDSDPIHYSAFREMLQEINFNGGVPFTEEFYIENFAGKHNDEVMLFLFPDDLQRGLQFTKDKEAMFRRLAPKQLKPINGLYKLKKWVENHGLRRAAVTSAPRPNAELMLSLLGLSDFFEAVILGDECEHTKPHPEPYLKALELLNISKDHTFIFEDSVSGIKAGVAAGMPVIGLTTGNPAHLLMEAKPTFLIKDYEDQKLWEALEELDKTQAAKL